MHNIEVRYFEAKASLSPAKRLQFMNVGDATADQIVDQIFTDIRLDYQKRFPTPPEVP